MNKLRTMRGASTTRNPLKTKMILFRVMLAFLLPVAAMADSDAVREHLSLDQNWKFHLGDDWPGALKLDKAGSSSGPAARDFDDNTWRTVTLPHDWAVELPFDQAS